MKSQDRVDLKIDKAAKGRETIKNNLWYGVIGILSVAVLVLFPMIGSGLPLSLSLPDTFAGWLIYVTTKLAVAAINITIFHGFMEQGKLNVSTYWKKIIADEILHRVRQKESIPPIGPEEWLRREYKSKGITICVTSVLSCVVLSQVILTFDITVFISYLLTLLIGLTSGVAQMYKAETYWSADYYDYAIYTMEQHNKGLPPEFRLHVHNKKIYEGENVIYEYERIQEPCRTGSEK